jgi:hypothetical protein
VDADADGASAAAEAEAPVHLAIDEDATSGCVTLGRDIWPDRGDGDRAVRAGEEARPAEEKGGGDGEDDFHIKANDTPRKIPRDIF